jgi:MarR family transcriptional regulator, lower aerobic nicotinate degradation pathway regulator
VAPSARKSKQVSRKPSIGRKNETSLIRESDAGDLWRGKTLLDRPGFLVRRLYQIHVALFIEECASEAITPIQYSVLAALEQLGTTDQTTLSRATALDRTNVADVLKRLAGRRLLKRSTSPTDQRMAMAGLTPEGRALLKRLARSSARAHERTVAALSGDDRTFFLNTLDRLIEAGGSNRAIVSEE